MTKINWLRLLIFAGLCTGFASLGIAQESVSTKVDNHATTAKTFEVKKAVLKIVEERNVPARESGIIKKSIIREGASVKSGQQLMQIDNSQALVELKKATKELAMAKFDAESTVDLEYAKRSISVAQAELTRARRSNQRRPGVVAQSELDQLSLVVQRSIAEKEKTEFQMRMRAMTRDVREIEIEQGKLKNELHRLNAPIDGMIVEVYRREGEWVEASESVARVVRLDKLRTEVKLPANIALNNLVGATATFYPKLTEGLGKASYSGSVVFVYPEANPISTDVRVWIEIENSDMKLIPGLTGRLEVNLPAPSEVMSEVNQSDGATGTAESSLESKTSTDQSSN
jgi:macrolide-specific efflux system membrane fusion protein